MSAARRGGSMGLIDALHDVQASDASSVIGIVFATSGSTYQKPGALVLLDDEGLRYGVISGGCLEPELEDRARHVLQTARAEIVDFDMRTDEDVTFGSGTGCRGRVRMLLLPQRGDSPLSQALLASSASEGELAISLIVEGEDVGGGTALLQDRRWSWNGHGEHEANSTTDGSREVVQLTFAPPPCLLLLGAGAESVPLQAFVRQLGWKSIVVDHRGRWVGFARRAQADDIIEQTPDAAARIWRTRRIDAAIALSHNYSIDLKNLALCADTEIGYIGLLGPATRRDMLLADLGEHTSARLRDRLHAPVGLALGGSGPDAIALSIAAELQQYFARRT